MSRTLFFLVLCAGRLSLGTALAQTSPTSSPVGVPPPPPPSSAAPTATQLSPPPPPAGGNEASPTPPPMPDSARVVAPPSDAPTLPPPPPADTQQRVPAASPAAVEAIPSTTTGQPPDTQPPGAIRNPEAVRPLHATGPVLDGHLRSGPFLSGPGSLTFILHHTLMGAGGGLVTQGVTSHFRFDQGSRESMLIGTLVGAGLGFGVSSWWQFNHWMSLSTADFGVVNSAISGMFFTGLLHLFTDDGTTLAWTSLIGAEVGAWLTATIGTGDLAVSDGLFVASGGLWGLVSGLLLLGIVNYSGSRVHSVNSILDPLLIAPGIGAGLAAFATLRMHPSTTQILRADAFGAGMGAAVFLASALIIGSFQSPTPYALGLLSSVSAIAAVSLFWEESAERPRVGLFGSSKRNEPYRCTWW